MQQEAHPDTRAGLCPVIFPGTYGHELTSAVTFKTVTMQLAVEQVTEPRSNATSDVRQLSLHVGVNRA